MEIYRALLLLLREYQAPRQTNNSRERKWTLGGGGGEEESSASLRLLREETEGIDGSYLYKISMKMTGHLIRERKKETRLDWKKERSEVSSYSSFRLRLGKRESWVCLEKILSFIVFLVFFFFSHSPSQLGRNLSLPSSELYEMKKKRKWRFSACFFFFLLP